MPVTVFGGGAVQTAYVSFTALDITNNSITLVWPTSYFNVPSVVDGIHYDVLAASFTVTNDFDNVNTVTLPDATESSVGSNFIVTNIGESPFQLLKSDRVELIDIPSAEDANSFWVQLTDNSTPEGEWAFVQFGAGTSSADASALSGNGLVSLLGRLNTNIVVQPILNAPYQISIFDRARLLLWQAGSGQLYLPDIGDVSSGYYTSVNNQGSGVITISGDETVDNQPSLIVAPGQSLSIITDGIKWWTLGFGQNIASSNFPPGSSNSPSIAFSIEGEASPKTGLYYYQASFPPVVPPGIGLSVNSTQIANFSGDGLFMNAGKSIRVQDSTAASEIQIISNADDGQILWDRSDLTSPASLTINGSNILSRLTLGPFSEFTIEQGALVAQILYNGHSVLVIDSTGKTNFLEPVVFENTTQFLNPAQFDEAVEFNAPVNCFGSVSLSDPLSIASGGTGANNQQDALNAIMPPPELGDIIYFDGADWVPLSIGTLGQYLAVVDYGGGNLGPRWVGP